MRLIVGLSHFGPLNANIGFGKKFVRRIFIFPRCLGFTLCQIYEDVLLLIPSDSTKKVI